MAVRAQRQGRPIPRPSAGRLNELSVLLVFAVVATNTFTDAGTAVSRLTTPQPAVDVPATEAQPPNIVVILLDGYPRSDVLERRLGIDDSDFLAGLSERGFDVSPDSHSNYALTALTLASMFQMRYLDEVDDVAEHVGSSGVYHDLLRYAATKGPAWSALRDAGYEVVYAPPGWEHVRLDGASDRVVNDGEITDLERSLLEETWLMDVVTLISPDLITNGLRDRLVSSFDALDDFAAADRESPAFLFLHVPGPHPPLVVDANGQTVPIDARALGADDPAAMGLTRSEYAARWESELAYLNQRVLESVDELAGRGPEHRDPGHGRSRVRAGDQGRRPCRPHLQPVRRVHARRGRPAARCTNPGEPHASAPERIPGNRFSGVAGSLLPVAGPAGAAGLD